MKSDVIVVGSRVAGAATAMLLARKGMRVTVLDRAHFPSDTLSSHQLQTPGVACLSRWGLLDELIATGVPPTTRVRFDPGPAILRGRVGRCPGGDALYSPRRTVLDSLLVRAARDSGAEVIEGFDVTEVMIEADRVTGVRGSERSSGRTRAIQTYSAPLVIGADGKHSLVAKAVAARTYHESPPQSAAFYAYWQRLELDGGEMYGRDRRLIGAWSTHDDLCVTYVGLPAADFADFRADTDSALLASLDQAGDLGERARAATRVEPIRGTPDLPHQFRSAYGEGWALVGDAGLVMDPITGQGIGHALQDAEHLAEAVAAGLDGPSPLQRSLASYQKRRDSERLPMHKMTADLASFAPRPGSDVLFRALAENEEQTQRFLDVLAGVQSPRAFFSPGNLRRLLGWRGMWQLIRAGR